MALIDNAVLVPNAGNYFTAPTGTPMPVDLRSIGSEWANIGHTSLEDVLSFSSEGGEKTTLGTLQNKALRNTYTPRVDAMALTLEQFDVEALKLYYGSNAVDVNGDGLLIGVPQNPTPTTRAFLAVFIDGESVFAIYAPKAEIFRGEDVEIADTESLAGLPLSITPLIFGDNQWPYALTPLGRVTDPGEEDQEPEPDPEG